MIVVLGSINLDISLSVDRLPGPGETVLASTYLVSPGGKGANQACAAAKAGARTHLFGRVGDDSFAPAALALLAPAGVDLTGVAQARAGTGCATICVDGKGENQIVAGSAANLEVTQDQVPDALLTGDSTLLLQMEIPPEQNWAIIVRAKARGSRVILNVAPAAPVPREVLSQLDYLVVNQTEARQIAGAGGPDEPGELARYLFEQHQVTTVITLGGDGLVCAGAQGLIALPAQPVEVQDTTGAGDTFCGCLAAALDAQKPLRDALAFASAAAGLACTRPGAQTALPTRTEILRFLPS